MKIINKQGLSKEHVLLRDYQIDHFNKLKNILSSNLGCIDTSDTGTGKTWIAMALILHYQPKRVLVVGPKSSEKIWRDAGNKCGLTNLIFISKDTLRSRKGCKIKHPYLIRDDTDPKKTRFMITNKYKKFIREGGFLILDESHAFRNSSSDQYRAVKALMNGLIHPDEKHKSRYMMLTASPLTKVDQTITLLRMIGFIQSKLLYKKDRFGFIVFKGLQELIDICSTFDPSTTKEIMDTIMDQQICINTKTTKNIAHKLFAQVVKYHITSACDASNDICVNIQKFNGYYDVDPETKSEFMKSLKEMETQYKCMLEKKKKNNIMKGPLSNLATIMHQRQKTELLKASIFARLTRSRLKQEPNAKIVCYVHFIQTLDILKQSLNDLNPIILKGSVKIEEREKRIHEFQTNPSANVLLGILKISGESISLHDKIGNAPRYNLISPGYELILSHQAAGRTIRGGSETKSDVTIIYVYIRGGELETEIYNSLAQGSNILKDTLINGSKIQLPGDLPTYIEKS